MVDVLKPRLAKEALSAAEEELSELGGAEDEQTEFRGGQEPGGDFDLVRSWKLTRLRCMVYTRLGDMVSWGLFFCSNGPRGRVTILTKPQEEDDEDEYLNE